MSDLVSVSLRRMKRDFEGVEWQCHELPPSLFVRHLSVSKTLTVSTLKSL